MTVVGSSLFNSTRLVIQLRIRISFFLLLGRQGEPVKGSSLFIFLARNKSNDPPFGQRKGSINGDNEGFQWGTKGGFM